MAALGLGDRTGWDKEVSFRYVKEIGRGEVEIEYSKKRGTEIEVEMMLVEKYRNKPIEIFLSNALICTIPAQANIGPETDYKEPCNVEKPQKGDLVKAVVARETLFEGQFR